MSDINAINYEPLEADKHAFQTVYNQHANMNTAIFGIAAALCVVSWFIISTFVLGWIGIALAMLRFFYISNQMRLLKDSIWEKFAEANDWLIIPELAPDLLLPPSLQFGHSQDMSPVIGAQLGNVHADMFVYRTTVGEGKNQQVYYFSVARVVLPAPLPHMMLRAKHGVSNEVRQDFPDGEKLELEGDFIDYFSLQIDKGQEVDALEILTPDVMQTLVNFSQKEDIEIVLDSLYFIVSGDDRTPEGVAKLVQSVASLTEQIVEQIVQTTAPKAVAPTEQAAPEPSAATATPVAV